MALVELTAKTLGARHVLAECREPMEQVVKICEQHAMALLFCETDNYVILQGPSGKQSAKIPAHQEYLLTMAAVLESLIED